MSDEPKNKNLALVAPAPKPKRAPTLYAIVVFKLIKGAAALALAIGAINLTDNNLPEDFRNLLAFLHIDPEKRFFLDMADRVAEITPTNLKWLAAGSVVYGLFMLLQAGGLVMRVSWIVWLVIGESAFFVPIEVFELVRKHVVNPEIHPMFTHPKIGIAFVLVANVAIVWYLFKNRARLIRHYHQHHLDL